MTTTPNPVSVLDVIGAIDALLPQAVSCRVGPEHAGESVAPPRVVWIPLTDSYSAPLNNGGRHCRPVWTVESSWQCVLLCKGDDAADPTSSFRALEALRDRVLSAVHAVCRGNAEIQSGRFDQQDDSALQRFGRSYTMTVMFRLEVLPADSGQSNAEIKSINVSGDLSARIER